MERPLWQKKKKKKNTYYLDTYKGRQIEDEKD